MKHLVPALSLLTAAVHGGPALVTNGASDYTIVRPAEATPSQVYAAEELQSFVKEMTGATLQSTTDAGPLPPKAILLGITKYTEATLGMKVDLGKLGNDGFRVKTCGPHVVIAASGVRGTLYGVYELLEHYGGCRWYASFHSVIPKRTDWTLPDIDDTQVPAFVMREPFWFDMFKGDFAARCRANGNRMQVTEKHGGKIRFGAGLFVHTFYRLMSPSEFFKDHPEYFSELNGTRVADHAQLCLTNPDVVRICTERMLERIRKDPDGKLYSLSQNDWRNPCQCAKCKAIDDREGTPAGTLINFVNQVAERIEKEFPDIWIETLAYQYTRTPPKTIKPRHNVVPRLCTIECDFSNPLDVSTYMSNQRFVEEIRGWSAITDKLYVWDYTTNFAHYVGPHPNFGCLQGNAKFFRDNGVVGLFEQGAYQGRHAEFAELRAWILAKLLWNPDQDIGPLYDDFFNGYYGAAAPPIREYWTELQAFGAPLDVAINIWTGPTAKYYPKGFFEKSLELWDRAEAAVSGDLQRSYNVRMSAVPVYYALLRRMDAAPVEFAFRGGRFTPKGADSEYTRLAKIFMARFKEAGDMRTAENMTRQNDFLTALRSRTEGLGTLAIQGGGFEANLVNEFGGRVCRLTRSGGPNLLDPSFGVDAILASGDYTAPAKQIYGGKVLGPGKATTSHTWRRQYSITRAVSVDTNGMTMQTTVASKRTEPRKIRPVLRAALALGNASAVCTRVGEGKWRTTVVGADQTFRFVSVPDAAPGQTITLASPLTGQAVAVTLPACDIERVQILCDARGGSTRLFVMLPGRELEGHSSFAVDFALLPLGKVTGLPKVDVPAAHRADRFEIQSFQLGIGRRGTWGDHVSDPLATDGSALKLFNTHYEWCTQWYVNPQWFEPGAKYTARMRIRVDKTGAEGEAFWAGVYDTFRRKGFGQINPKASAVKDGYQWYTVATSWTPEAKQYVWIGPGRFDKETLKTSPAINAVYIDRFEFARVEE